MNEQMITDKKNILFISLILITGVISFCIGRQSVLLPGQVVLSDKSSLTVEKGSVVIGTPSKTLVGVGSPATVSIDPNSQGVYFSNITIFPAHRSVDFYE